MSICNRDPRARDFASEVIGTATGSAGVSMWDESEARSGGSADHARNLTNDFVQIVVTNAPGQHAHMHPDMLHRL